MDASNVVDISSVLTPLAQLVGIVAVGALPLIANRAVKLFEAKTHIQLTQAQQDTVRGAVATAAGAVDNLVSRGLMGVHDVHIDNPRVRALATTALNAVPDAAASFGLTVPDVAHMIVGKVGQVFGDPPEAVPAPTVAVKDAGSVKVGGGAIQF